MKKPGRIRADLVALVRDDLVIHCANRSREARALIGAIAELAIWSEEIVQSCAGLWDDRSVKAYVSTTQRLTRALHALGPDNAADSIAERIAALSIQNVAALLGTVRPAGSA